MGDQTPMTGDSQTQSSTLDDLTSRLSQMLSQPQPPSNNESVLATFGVKLNDKNYGIWSQVMETYIVVRDKLGYINGDLPKPVETDPAFRKWRTENATVKGWLIGSIDPTLVGNFIIFPTAKGVWDAVATTYFDGTDTSQVYDLKRKVSRLRHHERSLETYYNSLQGLWREIYFRRPNPMTCEEDIRIYNTTVQEDRVYTFLDGLDDRLDNIRADILRMQPFPTIEQAYAEVRKENQRQTVKLTKEDTGSSLAMMSKGGQKSVPPQAELRLANGGKKSKTSSEAGGCTHCGNPKHTKDNCFKLHGYPEWWHDLKAKKKRESGYTSLANVEPTKSESSLSLVPHRESSTATANYSSAQDDSGNQGWIIDSGATDHMTFDSQDFVEASPSQRTYITNANGGKYPVTGAGRVSFSLSFHLSNTLLVPSLSSKLLSIGQVTEDLNCRALIYPQFCLFQDILTEEVIGHGTKRDGLYYMDDFSPGKANKVSQDRNKANEIWLWHRRLGHPSFSYLKHLFLDLLLNICETTFHCESSVLAKSHRTFYHISPNQCPTPFMLVHSDVWGPAPTTNSSGTKWFVIFVDDCTQMTWLYLMKHKNEVARIFKAFHTMVTTQFSSKLKVLRSDNGGEFVNRELQDYFCNHGLYYETSCARTPQQNGIAERKNRHVLEIARALLLGAHAPRRYWPDAVTIAVYLINRLPSKVLGFRTPLQALG